MREMMKSKIHRATIIDSNLNYEGSITVDPDLLDLAYILPRNLRNRPMRGGDGKK